MFEFFYFASHHYSHIPQPKGQLNLYHVSILSMHTFLIYLLLYQSNADGFEWFSWHFYILQISHWNVALAMTITWRHSNFIRIIHMSFALLVIKIKLIKVLSFWLVSFFFFFDYVCFVAKSDNILCPFFSDVIQIDQFVSTWVSLLKNECLLFFVSVLGWCHGRNDCGSWITKRKAF